VPKSPKQPRQNRASRAGSTDLLSLLRDHPEDEKTGANATLGITYQQWWATLKATELYAGGADFALGIEYKEDIAVLDSATAPSRVEFYQVKKHERDGVWTWSDLLRPPPTRKGKAAAPSSLAKLYSRRQTFSGHQTTLHFVSNLAYKVPLEDETKGLQHSTNCGLHEFSAAKANEVKAKIAKQLGIAAESIDLTGFSLMRTNLPLGEQNVFVSGKLGQLSDTGKIAFKVSRPHISAQMLAAEFQQRACHTDYANSFEKLKARCLTRSEITRVLQDVESAGPPVQVVLEQALERLDKETYHFGRLQQIRREKVSLCADACDRTNTQISALARHFQDVKGMIASALANIAQLGIAMETLTLAASKKAPKLVSGVSEGYLNGLALLVINNAIDVNVCTAPPSTQPKEEE
jgi:hypothetical protein